MQIVQIMTWIIYQSLSLRFFACLHSSGSGSLVKGCCWMYSDFGVIEIHVIPSECRNDNRRVLYSQDGWYAEVRGELLQEDRVFFCSQVSHDPNIGTANICCGADPRQKRWHECGIYIPYIYNHRLFNLNSFPSFLSNLSHTANLNSHKLIWTAETTLEINILSL